MRYYNINFNINMHSRAVVVSWDIITLVVSLYVITSMGCFYQLDNKFYLNY